MTPLNGWTGRQIVIIVEYVKNFDQAILNSSLIRPRVHNHKECPVNSFAHLFW